MYVLLDNFKKIRLVTAITNLVGRIKTTKILPYVKHIINLLISLYHTIWFLARKLTYEIIEVCFTLPVSKKLID